jgi:hypothetical protein
MAPLFRTVRDGLACRRLARGRIWLALIGLALGVFGIGASAQTKSAPAPAAAPSPARQLETLAQQLNRTPTAAVYQQLAKFATAQAKSLYGARAALALGYYDYTKKRFPEARKWLEQAAADPLLGDYALYWTAMADRATGANQEALAEFHQYRQRYPNGVMTDSTVEELVIAALVIGRPEEAVAALDGYEKTGSRAALVLLRAQAREQAAAARAEQPLSAAADNIDVK